MNSTRNSRDPATLDRVLALASRSSSPSSAPSPSKKGWNPQFFSAGGFVLCAVLIGFLFAIVSIAGLREYTSILSGTVGSVRLGWQISALLGFTYLFVYLAFVLLAPILLIAAALLWTWQRLTQPGCRVNEAADRRD